MIERSGKNRSKMRSLPTGTCRRRVVRDSSTTFQVIATLLSLASVVSGSHQPATSGFSAPIKQVAKRQSSDKDGRQQHHFAPRLIHQPQGAQVQPNQPHTVECAVESAPEAEVRWFKDEQLLVSRPPHLEQTGGELMFFQMNDDDTGEYHCQATNYLGSVSSERFMLTVSSSRHDAKIRFEPPLAEVEPDKQVKFTCTIPTSGRRQQREKRRRSREVSEPEVSWRRNGRRLQTKWLDEDEELTDVRSRFVTKRVSVSEYVLIITRAQLKDDNATFTCLYTSTTNDSDDENDDNHQLPHESDPVRLRVYEGLVQQNVGSSSNNNNYKEEPANNRVQIEVNLGKPIDNLANSKDPILLQHNNNNNRTTQLIEPTKAASLSQTLRDLYEMAKPTLMILLLVFIVSTFVILQLIYIRKRTRQNRYMKHQYSGGSGSGTSSSSNGAIGGNGSSIDCGDPVLNSLMGRTLSAPSAISLAAAGKKYRSYRDHMRKVAAANDLVGNDLVDNYFAAAAVAAAAAAASSGVGSQHQTTTTTSATNSTDLDHEPFFGPPATALPNLYNQSLAAREQHRSLLQVTSEHMRSLSNLSHHQQSVQQSIKQQALRLGAGLNGSHLNLPLSFAFNATNDQPQQDSSVLHNSSLWPPHQHLAQFSAQSAGVRNHLQQQQQLIAANQRHLGHQTIGSRPNQATSSQLADSEHYQLVNCSSVSPSSTSSMLESANSGCAQNQRFDQVNHHAQPIVNHYSTIENNEEEEEDRYEELGDRSSAVKRSQIRSSSKQVQQQDSFRGPNRTSTFVTGADSLEETGQQKSSLRSSLMSSSNSSSSGCGDSNITSSSLMSSETFSRFGSKRNSNGRKEQSKNNSKPNQGRQNNYQDRLSPYAVSSICSTIPQPPPVNSEAMKALNEQFDINQLMLLDEPAQQTLPFDALHPPPPPPPPPPNRSPNNHNNNEDSDRCQKKRRSRQDA